MVGSKYYKHVLFTLASLMIAVSSQAQVSVAPNAPVSANRKKARLIYSRITGEAAHIDDKILVDMEALLDQGKELDAAALATAQPEFYNNTVRFFGQSMTTKSPSFKAPLTDFVATIMGVTKNGIDARDLLTANYLYQSNLTGAPVTPAALYTSNQHYAFLQTAVEKNSHLDLASTLVQVRQVVPTSDNAAPTMVNHPEPAGIMTSRAFMELCASAGTNRRCYEESMKKFMCTPIEQIADTTVPDSMVGKDVSRVPGGDPMVYQKTCRGCHGNMDAQRAAFSYLEFDNGRIKHGKTFVGGALFNATTRVAVKMNRLDANGFAGAYTVNDNSFTNYMPLSGAAQDFEFRNDNGGREVASIQSAGLSNYGRMIASSQGFSSCLVRKAFSTVCHREIDTTEAAVVRNITLDFENPALGGRKLKWLFERVVTDDACTGK